MDTLVRKAQRGDAEAFICLIEECRMTLLRVAYGYLGNEEDVADAIQDTILSAYEHIDTLKKGEHFKTWIVRILINHCTKMWRQNKKTVHYPDNAAVLGMKENTVKSRLHRGKEQLREQLQ